jgi:hypothetical protein
MAAPPQVTPEQMYHHLIEPPRITRPIIEAVECVPGFSRTKVLNSLDASVRSLALAHREFRNAAPQAERCQCERPIEDENAECARCGRALP